MKFAMAVLVLFVTVASFGESQVSQRQRDDAIRAAQRWKAIAEQWERNSNRFEEIAARNEATANKCIALLEDARKEVK